MCSSKNNLLVDQAVPSKSPVPSMVSQAVYKLVIVGGGPAGVGVLVRAARLGRLDELLRYNEEKKLHGVALIHSGGDSTLGGGNLTSYGIRSNTFAKTMYNSVLEDKPEFDPPEIVTGTYLEALRNHPTAATLNSTGHTVVPLADLGRFLNEVGQATRREMKKYEESSICMSESVVQRLEETKEGLIRVIVERFTAGTKTEQIELLTQKVALATGGKQAPPSLGDSSWDKKCFTSDYFLREEGYQAFRHHMEHAPSKKVCIVGGSHSAFSACYVLLNGITKATGVIQCGELPNDTLSFGPRDISLLHRGPIRCFYYTERDAEADGLKNVKVDRAGSVNTFSGIREDAKRLYKAIKSGQEQRIRLFQIKAGGSQGVQNKCFQDAGAIIWCCGYATNMVPVQNASGMLISMTNDQGQVKIDLAGRVLMPSSSSEKETDEILSGVYGVGVGFGLKAYVDEMNQETRADGVAIYQKRGASLVLAAVLGNSVYGKDCTSYEQMLEKQDDRKIAQTIEANKEKEAQKQLNFMNRLASSPCKKTDQSTLTTKLSITTTSSTVRKTLVSGNDPSLHAVSKEECKEKGCRPMTNGRGYTGFGQSTGSLPSNTLILPLLKNVEVDPSACSKVNIASSSPGRMSIPNATFPCRRGMDEAIGDDKRRNESTDKSPLKRVSCPTIQRRYQSTGGRSSFRGVITAIPEVKSKSHPPSSNGGLFKKN